MASGAASSPASAFAVAAALFRSRWEEAKLVSIADPARLALAEGELFSSIAVALEVLGASPVASEVGAGGVAAAMDVVPPVVEAVVTPPSVRWGSENDSRCPTRAGGEAWNALLFVANLESEVVSLFDRHRELAAAAYCRSASAPVVWLFVDFDMFHSGTGFDIGQARALWERWMRIVSLDRIRGGNKICVALHELPRD